MSISRRGIMGVLAGAPLAGKAVAETVMSGLGSGVLGSGSANASAGWGVGMNATAPAVLASPRMDAVQAAKLIFGDAQALAEIRSELYAEQRNINYVDPDIMVMKSWSPMAKIAFQRQRNVERALDELQDSRWDRPQRYLKALNDRMQRLMWGGS